MKSLNALAPYWFLRQRTLVLLLAAVLHAQGSLAVTTQAYTSGTGRSCTDSTCSKLFIMTAEIPGADQYEAVCQQLWANAAYIFPFDAYSSGKADGGCYYHHISSPTSDILFGGWSTVQATDPKNNGPSCPRCGNPINPAVGNKYQEELDYSDGKAFSLQFRRYYNSAAIIQGGHVGANWRSSFDRVAVVPIFNGTISTSAPATIRREDGRVYYLNYSSGQFVGTADVTYNLTVLTDSNGTVTGSKLVTPPNDETELYDTSGRLTSITSRAGLSLTLTYDTGNELATVADSFGHQLTFTYDSSGRVSTMKDQNNGVYQYGYDGNNNLTSLTYPDNTQRVYRYNEPAHTQGANLPNALTGIQDEAQALYATFEYDTAGYAVTSQHAGGADLNTLSYGVDGSGNDSTTVTEPLGAVRSYSFQNVLGASRNTYASQPAGQGCTSCGSSSSVTYDANGNVATSTDFNGNQATSSYDLTRNLETSRTEGLTGAGLSTPRTRTTTTSWHGTFRLPLSTSVYAGATATGTPLRTTSFSYDTSGNALTKMVTDPATTISRTWTYTYNAYGQVLTPDGPRADVSDVTTYTYYTCTTGAECGQIKTVTNAVGQVTTFNTYNVYAQPLTITDPNGIVTTLTYDARQRLISRQVGSETTAFTYWPTGLLKQVVLADGSYLLYAYDAAHRLTQISDGLGNAIGYTLDAMGNRTAENGYDPSNTLHRTHTRVFNTLSQLYQDVNAAGTAAVTTSFGYDPNGNQKSIAAPLSRTTTNAYDELNRLRQITDPANGITQFGYDANDNLTSVIDPRGLATVYSYSGFGDLVTQASPDTGTTVNTYDLAGNLATSTDARGAISTYSYDALNRVTSVAYSQGGTTDQTIAFTYDARTNGKGHLAGASDANHSTAWTYDALGRVTSKSQTVGGVTRSVGYSYTNGNLTSLTTPSGQVVFYGYNGDHQVTSVTVNGSTVLNSVTYEPLGPVSGWTWGNGTTTTRTYDTDGKISQIVSAGTKTYGYDNAFRITGISDTSNGAANWTYGYDALDRITSGTSPSITRGWTYDANGNRLTEGGTAASTYSISPTNNRITAIIGALARTYGYDAAGNTTSYATVAATYNNAGRLQTLTQGSSTEIAIYNAVGQRIQKSGGTAGTALYAYDEAGHLLGEYDGTGALIEETVWLGNIPVATLRPSGSTVAIYYVHSDQLNTPRAVTRPADNLLIWTWYSDPFGTDAANENPAGAGTFVYNLRFPGQVFGGPAGLHDNGFRPYDPAIGGYPQSDPSGLNGGINTYAYAHGNPLSHTDRRGLAPEREETEGEPGETDPLAVIEYQILLSKIRDYEKAFEDPTWRAPNSAPGRSDVLRLQDVLRDLQNEGSCPAPREFRGSQRKPGSLGTFKGTDALRAENDLARDAAKAAGLDQDQARQLHDEIGASSKNTGVPLTYPEILQIAISIKNGTL